MGRPKSDSDVQTLPREEVSTREPLMYKVILLNDNYTTMDFVVMVLEHVFDKSSAEALAVMLAVHERGSGVAGVFTKEIAETKVALVQKLARQNEFPLKCVMESE